MRPDYKTFPWLEARWTAESLMRLTETDIQDRSNAVDRLSAENNKLYFNAKLQREDAEREFKRQHPRSHFAKYRIDPPPDLIGDWKRLLTRRNNTISKIYKAQAEKRETFMGRMTKGKVRAMRRREKNIRKLIAKCAQQMDIEIVERATDKQLEELLATLIVRTKNLEKSK